MKQVAIGITSGLAALGTLVLSPFSLLGAYLFDDESHVTAHELRVAVEGLWVIESRGHHAVVTLRQSAHAAPESPAPSLVAPAGACGEVTFVRSASACVNTSSLPLDVQVFGGDLRLESDAMFTAHGNYFVHGYLELPGWASWMNETGIRLGPDGVQAATESTTVRVRRIAIL